MGFLRQEYWSGLLFSSPGDLPDTGVKPVSPALQADSLLLNHWGSPYTSEVVISPGNLDSSFDYTDLCLQSDVSAFKYTSYICHSFSSKE